MDGCNVSLGRETPQSEEAAFARHDGSSAEGRKSGVTWPRRRHRRSSRPQPRHSLAAPCRKKRVLPTRSFVQLKAFRSRTGEATLRKKQQTKPQASDGTRRDAEGARQTETVIQQNKTTTQTRPTPRQQAWRPPRRPLLAASPNPPEFPPPHLPPPRDASLRASAKAPPTERPRR